MSCNHEGIGEPGCYVCDPDKGRVISALRAEVETLREEGNDLRRWKNEAQAERDALRAEVERVTKEWDEASTIAANAAQRHVEAEADAAALREALEGMGAMPEGYCFCHYDRDPNKTNHVGECAVARAALATDAGTKLLAERDAFKAEVERLKKARAEDEAFESESEKLWGECEEELEAARAEVERLKAALRGVLRVAYRGSAAAAAAREALGEVES